MLVEAAFVLPVLFLVVFGIIEFGLAFEKSLSLSEATRSGVRVGAAQPRQPAYQDAILATLEDTLRTSVGSDAIEYLTIYKADAETGEPVDGGFETCTTCYRYQWDPVAEEFVAIAGAEWPSEDQSACGAENNTDFLGVYVRAEHRMATNLLPVGDLTLTESSVMRLEPLPLVDECEPG